MFTADNKIYYEQYLRLSEWTKLEAVCLLSGIDPAYYLEQLPDIFRASPLSGFFPCPPRIEMLQKFMMPVLKEINSLSEEDYSPKEVINWAISKDFDVPVELMDYADREQQKALLQKPQAGNPSKEAESNNHWNIAAREIGKKLHKEKPRLSIEQIAKQTHTEMVARKDLGESGMTGRGGKVPSAETIKRHALTGINT